jgi:UDP-3-O-[3-hydroxymyristoyl] glucosamine N-acyltransferase
MDFCGGSRGSRRSADLALQIKSGFSWFTRMNFSQDELTDLLQPTSISGGYTGTICGIAALDRAQNGDVAFLGNRKYLPQLKQSMASIILVPCELDSLPRENQAYFKVPNPSWAFAKICAVIERERTPPLPRGIHPTAVIDPMVAISPDSSVGAFAVIEGDVTIEAGVIIGAQSFIGRGCHIGANSCLKPRVTLYAHCRVGKNVTIHSGAVIGSDGFGYETVEGVHCKIPHIGIVIIEDDVEIGANSTIDRARFAETRIGRGTKVDNLVQIGHNVHMGNGCLIVAQTGIAGSTTLGNYVVLAGQVGVVGHISIGDGTQIAAQAGVSKDIPAGSVLRGTPAMPVNKANRFYVLRAQIPELFRRVDALEQK